MQSTIQSIKNTDLKVSSIAYGTGSLGLNMTQKDANILLDTYFELGGNQIDTAKIYSDWVSGEPARSEKTIGRWLKEKGGRNKIVIGTKGAHPFIDSMSVPRFTNAEISGDLDESLANLNTDYIDLYWLHRDNEARTVEEILELLESFVKQGKIRYYGCSNWKTARMQEARQIALDKGYKGFVANQTEWSCAKINNAPDADTTMTKMDNEMLTFHKNSGWAAYAYTSQAQGLYQKVQKMSFEKMDEGLQKKYLNDANKEIYHVMKEYQQLENMSVESFILSYFHSQDTITRAIPIFGTIDKKHLEQIMKCEVVHFTEEQMNQLNHLVF